MFRRSAHALDIATGSAGRLRFARIASEGGRTRPPAGDAGLLRRKFLSAAPNRFEHRLGPDVTDAAATRDPVDLTRPKILDVAFRELPDPEAAALRARFDRSFPLVFLIALGGAALLAVVLHFTAELFRLLVGG